MRTNQKLTPTSETAKKTLGLLDILSKGKREWTAAEVAKEANLPHSTAFRLLSTLEELRFIEYDAESRRYQLGLKLLELGHLVSQRLDLPSRAMPFLKSLRKNRARRLICPFATGTAGSLSPRSMASTAYACTRRSDAGFLCTPAHR